MPCEMCGNEGPLKTAMIEGNKMRVCNDCAKFGEVVEPPSSSSPPSGGSPSSGNQPNIQAGLGKPKRQKKRRDVFSDNQKVLVEDYGQRIREARQTKDLTPEELADQINEKKSLISHVERNDHHPSDELVKKLERALDVTLMEKPKHTEMAQNPTKGASAGKVTLGDLLKDAMDKEDES